MRYLWSVGSRYGAILLQFLVVMLVARGLPQVEAGAYFVSFGLVASLFPLAGWGISDGIVLVVGGLIARGELDAVRPTLLRGAAAALVLTLGSAVVAVAIAAFWAPLPVVAIVAAWWVGYGIVFFCGQALVGLHQPAVGSFVAYTLINACYAATTIPYLLLVKEPHLLDVLGVAVLGTALASAIAIGLLARGLMTMPSGGGSRLAQRLLGQGILLATSRFLQASLAWIPVWCLGAISGTADAAVYSAGSRLVVAVTAVIASLRFAIRPEVIRLAAIPDWSAIEMLGRRVSAWALGVTLVAYLGLWLVGTSGVAVLFGESYAGSTLILAILLLGALAEAWAGPVDEILKMSGHAVFVRNSLVAAVMFEVFASLSIAHVGPLAVAAVVALTFWLMYSAQIYFLWRQRGIVIHPGARLRFGS